MLARSDLEELTDCALEAATEAAALIAASRPQEIGHKTAGASLASQVVTEVDRRSEQLILGVLEPSRRRFDLGLLTEEEVDDGSRHRADFFWCIDPLDGTLPFIEGRPGSAVSIALVARDGTPQVGVVADATGGSVFHAIAGVGAYCDGRPWVDGDQPGGGALSLFADRSLLANNGKPTLVTALEEIAEDLGLDGVQIEVGAGAVMNAVQALLNPAGCYLKLPSPTGGSSIWDFAATACLFQAQGAVATDLAGRPLDLNRADSTRMNHRGVLYATDEELAGHLRALGRRHTASAAPDHEA